MEAVATGYIHIPSVFRGQTPKAPDAAPGAVNATVLAPGTFNL